VGPLDSSEGKSPNKGHSGGKGTYSKRKKESNSDQTTNFGKIRGLKKERDEEGQRRKKNLAGKNRNSQDEYAGE